MRFSCRSYSILRVRLLGDNRLAPETFSTPARAEAFKQTANTFGVTVKDVFWTQGRYDIVIIAEAPDELTATALNLSLSAQGNIRTESLRAFSAADMTQIVGKMA
jgi:uncharacterized protein with GYD domain